ncbi:hypothetical protein bas69_0086 [Escherichia phage AlfredRasser]|nr:hypothetical protein bas69_0086 [Escherichia phage AlfredRasser]
MSLSYYCKETKESLKSKSMYRFLQGVLTPRKESSSL